MTPAQDRSSSVQTTVALPVLDTYSFIGGVTMARGDKSSYTDKQKRQAEHIEEGYEARGVNEEEAERRAWATVNKTSGGGNRSGSGRGKPTNKAPARKGGRLGGAASAARPARARSAAAKKAARTRARKG
jgi:plasmid stabilization system protein ParE